jgi:RNA ligase
MQPIISEKYPRTAHFPFSEGAQNDDRILSDWQSLLDKEIVITEKLDGENTCLKTTGFYARSHGAINQNPWAKNIKTIWEKLGSSLGNFHVFGENLYAIHSIEYTRLEHHFYVFGIRENDLWLSWEEVNYYANLMELPVVPVVSQGFFTKETLFKEIQQKQKTGSAFGGTSEGVVCRSAVAYPDADFQTNVLKYVRKNHVQTDAHWSRNWKRAPLWFEQSESVAKGELGAI